MNVKNSTGELPLHLLCTNRNTTPEIFEEFIQLYVTQGSIDAKNNRGETPLHLAVTSSSDDSTFVCEILLKMKANPNLKNLYEQTPLHWAVNVQRTNGIILPEKKNDHSLINTSIFPKPQS